MTWCNHIFKTDLHPLPVIIIFMWIFMKGVNESDNQPRWSMITDHKSLKENENENENDHKGSAGWLCRSSSHSRVTPSLLLPMQCTSKWTLLEPPCFMMMQRSLLHFHIHSLNLAPHCVVVNYSTDTMQCSELKYVYVDILTIYIILWWSNQMLVIHNIQPLHCIAKADPAESLFEMCDFHCGTVSGQPSPAQSTTGSKGRHHWTEQYNPLLRESYTVALQYSSHELPSRDKENTKLPGEKLGLMYRPSLAL